MIEAFSAPQVVKSIYGLTYSTLDFWSRSGFFKPSLLDSNGRGSTRLYSLYDVVILSVVTCLRKHGIGLDEIRCVVDLMGNEPTKAEIMRLHDTLYIVSRNDGVLILTDDPMKIIASDPFFSWVIPVTDHVVQVTATTKGKGIPYDYRQEETESTEG